MTVEENYKAAALQSRDDKYARLMKVADALAKSLKDCSDDLQTEVDNNYCGLQDIYTDEKRKYQLDIIPVTEARNALAAFNEFKENGR